MLLPLSSFSGSRLPLSPVKGESVRHPEQEAFDGLEIRNPYI